MSALTMEFGFVELFGTLRLLIFQHKPIEYIIIHRSAPTGMKNMNPSKKFFVLLSRLAFLMDFLPVPPQILQRSEVPFSGSAHLTKRP